SVLDPDTTPAFRNNLVSVNDSRFEVTGGALYLKAGQVVDFDVSPAIELVLTAGSGAEAISTSVRVEVVNADELLLDLGVRAFTAVGGWSDDDRYPRQVADVNGDGRADIVGFGEAGVYVA